MPLCTPMVLPASEAGASVTLLPFGATITAAVRATGSVNSTRPARAWVTDISLSAASMRCAASAGISPSKSMLTQVQW